MLRKKTSMCAYIYIFFLPFIDGNAAGTGPGDPWTGGGGGVQPPYSGYAPPHLAQPAYPMHLPHDPMVSSFLAFLFLVLSFFFFLFFLCFSFCLLPYSRKFETNERSIDRSLTMTYSLFLRTFFIELFNKSRKECST